MTFEEFRITYQSDEQMARAQRQPRQRGKLMEHALPRRTAGTPRSWSLCMNSENHGTVGPAGCKFSHAPEKHERVQVVEIVPAGSPPAPGVDLSGLMRFGFCDINDDEFVERPDGAYFLAHQVEERVTCAPAAKPVGEFKGYVDGQPAVTWLDRDNMPRVGTKLFACAQAFDAASDLVGGENRDAAVDRALKAAQVWANEEYMCGRRMGKGEPGIHDRADAAKVECTAAILALAIPVAAQAGQVAVPEADVRNAALEEAAAVCDELHYNWKFDDEPDSNSGPRSCAKGIRALAAPSPAKESK